MLGKGSLNLQEKPWEVSLLKGRSLPCSPMPYRRAHRALVAASIYSIKLLTCSQISFYSHAESCFSLFLLSLVSKIYQFCTGTHVLRQYSLQYLCLQLGLITSNAWSSLLLPQNGVYVVHAYVHPSHHCTSSRCVAGAWRTWLLLLGISKILLLSGILKPFLSPG